MQARRLVRQVDNARLLFLSTLLCTLGLATSSCGGDGKGAGDSAVASGSSGASGATSTGGATAAGGSSAGGGAMASAGSGGALTAGSGGSADGGMSAAGGASGGGMTGGASGDGGMSAGGDGGTSAGGDGGAGGQGEGGTAAGGSGGAMPGTAGALDPSFSADGRVTFDSGKGNDRGRWITSQPDGKIVAIGKSNDDFILVRYDTNGDLDTTFGKAGFVVTDLDGAGDEGKSVSVQADGKIVLAGISTKNGNGDFGIARYLPSGKLDTTFAGTGFMRTDVLGQARYDEGKSLVIQTDGKYVIGGKANNGNDDDFAVVRYNVDGSLDTTFGAGGIVVTDVGGGPNEGNSIVQQPDGKLLLAGQSTSGADEDFAVVRYNADGSLDTTFGNGGVVTTAIGTGADTAFTVSVQPDGKIVVTGTSEQGARHGFAAVRYNGDGSLDPSFGGSGTVALIVGETDDICAGSAVQADGKLLLAGTAVGATDSQVAVVRLLVDGKLDPSFGKGGLSTFDFGGKGAGAYATKLQPDGKLLLVGDNKNGSDIDISVARMLTE